MHPEIADFFDEFTEFLHTAKTTVIFDLNLHHSNKRNIRLAEAANVHRKWLNSNRAHEYGNGVRQMLVDGTKIPVVDISFP